MSHNQHNRILHRRAAYYGFEYAESEARASEIGEAQPHTHGFMLIGKAPYSLDLKPVIAEIRADLDVCMIKLEHDAPGISLNKPILFRAKYRLRDSVGNGSWTFGVLLTGTKGRIIIPR